MEFAYRKTDVEDGYRYHPCVPIEFSYGDKTFLVSNVLVDTGAEITILPLKIAHVLDIQLDDSKPLRLASAGGGMFVALPSSKKIELSMNKEGCKSIIWKSTVYFSESETLALLGHYQCLEYFKVTFHGPERRLSIIPRFKR
jgi:hypothetical protein